MLRQTKAEPDREKKKGEADPTASDQQGGVRLVVRGHAGLWEEITLTSPADFGASSVSSFLVRLSSLSESHSVAWGGTAGRVDVLWTEWRQCGQCGGTVGSVEVLWAVGRYCGQSGGTVGSVEVMWAVGRYCGQSGSTVGSVWRYCGQCGGTAGSVGRYCRQCGKVCGQCGEVLWPVCRYCG